MKPLYIILLCVFLISLHILETNSKFNLLGSFNGLTSSWDECLPAVLVQCYAQNVHFVCSSNSTFCPWHIVHRIPGVVWTIYHTAEYVDLTLGRQDFCLLAADDVEDFITSAPEQFYECGRANVIVIFPTRTPPDLAALNSLFGMMWYLFIDIIVILADSLHCRVFTYIPFKGDSVCFDTSPVLIHSWRRNLPYKLNNSISYFPENKISNLHMCELSTDVDGDTTPYLFLETLFHAAMNSTPEQLNSSAERNIPGSANKRVIIKTVLTVPGDETKVVIPSHTEPTEVVLVVPNQPISSVEWFRLLNELSQNVWYGLLISLLVSVAVLCMSINGGRDLSSVFLFALQPLLGSASGSDHLPLHGRIYFLSWLLFCFVLSSCYLCTLLSKLTVPFSYDGIKTLSDFVDSDVMIFSSYSHEIIISQVLMNPRYEVLRHKIVYVNASHFDELIMDDGHDTAFIVPKYLVLSTGMVSVRPYHILPDVVLFTGQSVPVYLWKPSPYERFFKLVVLRIAAAGGFDRYRLMGINLIQDEYASDGHRRWKQEDPKPLSVSSLGAVFVIWLIGCGTAAIVFLIECFTKCCCSFYCVRKNIISSQS